VCWELRPDSTSNKSSFNIPTPDALPATQDSSPGNSQIPKTREMHNSQDRGVNLSLPP
jgi:hypothetical protein